MPWNDLEAKVCEGVVAILEADTTLQTLCGSRTDGFVLEWESLLLDVARPMCAYIMESSQPSPGIKDTRVFSFRFRIVAAGNNAKQTCREFAYWLERALGLQTNWTAQGLDASQYAGSTPLRADVGLGNDRLVPEDEAALDVVLTIIATQ